MNRRIALFSAGIIAPFSVYEGLVELLVFSTSEGKRVSWPRCFAISWSRETVLREVVPREFGQAEKMLPSAECPPVTPGWDVPEITVKSSRMSWMPLR